MIRVTLRGAGTPMVCVGAPEPAPTTDDDHLTLI
jgi:hypothetical protein